MSDKPMQLNPWSPITSKLDLAVLGKLGEELNEAGSAASRCIIQGLDEREPVTGKPNRHWLEEEIADVFATAGMVIEHFDLDRNKIAERVLRKTKHLQAWHTMLD